jgi:hypothetical protein
VPPRRVPLLYVQDGRFVQPDGSGGWRPWGEGDAALERARKLYAERESLYVFDLDAQLSGTANLEFYQSLEKKRVFPWVDVGARKTEDVMDAFFAGAEAITIQLRHMPPEMLEDVGDLAEADFYVGFAAEPRGIEKGLRAQDLVDLVGRVGATGVVLYESDGADFHTAENVAFELKRAGVPTAWVGRAGSAHRSRAAASEHLSIHVDPEAGG